MHAGNATSAGQRPAPARLLAQIGRSVEELTTPALVLDLGALERNIDTMARWAADNGVLLRPHAKIHKCPQIGRRQLDAGAVGLTTATAAEALAMLDAEPPEVLIANQVLDLDRLVPVAQRAPDEGLVVAVDDALGVERLSAAARSAETTLGALIEIDVGMSRGGVRSIDAARRLAAKVLAAPGVTLRGVMGYEGHVVTEPDRERRQRGAAEAMELLSRYVEALRHDGAPIEIVSAAGTNTYDMTGRHEIVTEIQAGTYALMDTSYAPLAPAFQPALSIVGSVVSTHGERVVLDCGSKTCATTEMAPPRCLGYSLSVDQIDEEHALMRGRQAPRPGLGERVRLLVSYCGGTTNLHDGYCVTRHDEIVDAWPILARGPGIG